MHINLYTCHAENFFHLPIRVRSKRTSPGEGGGGYPKMVTNGYIRGRGYAQMVTSPQYFFNINIFHISHYFHHILSNFWIKYLNFILLNEVIIMLYISIKFIKCTSKNWLETHVYISKYCPRIAKCNNIECCQSMRGNVQEVLGGKFLPAHLALSGGPYFIDPCKKDET